MILQKNLPPRRLDAWLNRSLSSSQFTWREVVSLIFPSVLDSLSITFIGMLITVLISKNGEISVAAVSLVGPITGLITCLFSGISAGGTVVVAQCCGKGNPEILKRAVGMTLWLTVLIGVLVCLPFLLFPEAILLTLYPAAETAVMEKAVVYLAGCAWSIMIFSVYTAIFAILRGLGKSQRCLVLSIVINVAYLLFSLLFLNVLYMDIQGSVLALILARLIGAAAAYLEIFGYRPPVPMRFREVFSFDKSILRNTLKVSIPLGMEQICASCGAIVSEMYMIPLGTTALAANTIINSLIGVLYSPANAMPSVTVSIVGRCYGAGKQEEVRRYGKRCDQICRLLILAAAVIFYPLLPCLLGLYNPSPASYATAQQLIVASFPFLLLFWPVSSTMPNTLRAAGDTVFPSVFSLVLLWVVNIGLGYLLAIPAGLGLLGVWIASWTSWLVRCVGFGARFHILCRRSQAN